MSILPNYVKEPEWLRIGRLTVEVFIALFGVIGNIAVVIAISRCQFMRSVTNVFIRNLAIADLGVLLLSFPFAVVKEQTLLNWPFGKTICQVVYPLSEVFIGVSVWSMVIIAIDRYRGIVNDSHLHSLKTATFICAVTWLVSFLLISVPLLIVTKFWEWNGYKDCIQEWPEKSKKIMNMCYTIMSTFYNYVLPLSIILWTYYKIFCKINQSNTFNQSTMDNNALRNGAMARFEKKRIKRNNRARKILTPVVVIFAVALLPINVFRLTLMFIPSLVRFRYLWVIYNLCIVVTILNSSCNPFVYAVVSDNFRVAFKNMFRSKERLTHARRRSSTQLSLSTTAAFRNLKRSSRFKQVRSDRRVRIPSLTSSTATELPMNQTDL